MNSQKSYSPLVFDEKLQIMINDFKFVASHQLKFSLYHLTNFRNFEVQFHELEWMFIAICMEK